MSTAPLGRRLERWNRYLHRWASVAFTLSVIPLFFTADYAWVTVSLLVVMFLTGVVMAGTHYGRRLSRRRSLRPEPGRV